MRDPKPVVDFDLPQINERRVEAVASKADGLSLEKNLDPEAPKNFTSTTMPFNEYEHTILMRAVDASDYKSAKQFMRDAYLAKALKILEGKLDDP